MHNSIDQSKLLFTVIDLNCHMVLSQLLNIVGKFHNCNCIAFGHFKSLDIVVKMTVADLFFYNIG